VYELETLSATRLLVSPTNPHAVLA